VFNFQCCCRFKLKFLIWINWKPLFFVRRQMNWMKENWVDYLKVFLQLKIYYLSSLNLQNEILFIITFSDLPALIAHYSERVALLYHNLSNWFDSLLHWKGRYFSFSSFYSKFNRGSSFFAVCFSYGIFSLFPSVCKY